MTDTYSDQPASALENGAAQKSAETELASSAALLTGMKDLHGLDMAGVEARVLAWWKSGAESSCHMLAQKLACLPESFMTVAFHNRTRAFMASLTAIRSAFERYSRKDLAYSEAMSHIGIQLNLERNETRSWFECMNDLVCLMRWETIYERACEYVRRAFPTGDTVVDHLRSSLLDLMNQPHRFLESSDRDLFERTFMEFKLRYSETYARAHEETVGEASGSEGGLSGVDRVALKNLQLLSRLPDANRTPLARVRMILSWRRARRCQLPVRTILEQSSRCCCNFVPGAFLSVQASASQLNHAIHEEIERLRIELRKHSRGIITDLQAEGADESDSRQVAALLSQGPMIPLRPRTIEVLNSVLRKLPARHR